MVEAFGDVGIQHEFGLDVDAREDGFDGIMG